MPTGPNFERRPAPEVTCPNCDRRGLDTFYRVDRIPCHSMILLDSRREALDYHRGDLELGFCDSCGFICNTRFNPADNEYSQRFEESQGFSPTFNKFARELAARYAKRYNLRDKLALEIGCGKGEWLAQLCEESGGRGVGIDPGWMPSRLESPALQRLEFIVDFYGPKHAHIPADFIACRHTLEHIQPTREFMLALRETIGNRQGVTLFFELPEVLRELREGAFWDIYYEHCTYFSPGSLARLFRSTGFDVTHLSVEYDNQYIILDATPADGPTRPRLPLEDDLAQLREGVESFRTTCSASCARWIDAVRSARDRGQRVVVWGSGSKGVSFLSTLGLTDRDVELVVDINPFRQGKFMAGTGQEIVSPESLRAHKPDLVIIMNPIYVPEITRQLQSLGLSPRVLAV